MWQIVHFIVFLLSLSEAMFIGFKDGEVEKYREEGMDGGRGKKEEKRGGEKERERLLPIYKPLT